jgi:hypothetical protein
LAENCGENIGVFYSKKSQNNDHNMVHWTGSQSYKIPTAFERSEDGERETKACLLIRAMRKSNPGGRDYKLFLFMQIDLTQKYVPVY